MAFRPQSRARFELPSLLLTSTLLLAGCAGSPQSSEPLDHRWDAVTGPRCPDGATVSGVDVSTYQGGSINWAAVKASGQAFAISRVSDGTGYFDGTFDRNWSAMKAAGLVRGAYQFFEPGEDAVAQANLVIAHVGRLGAGDLPVMLDVEVTGGQSAATIVARIHQWVNAISAGTGKTPFIYTGAYFWDGNVGSSDFASLALDVAWYGTNCPGTPNAWGRWTFHQYTSSGSVPGIPGNVDVNVFNGDLAHLLAFAGTSLNAPPRGALDAADCSNLSGWAQDPDVAGSPIEVKLSVDGALGPGNSVAFAAGAHRPDLCTAIGSCDHGFFIGTPAALKDGKAHQVYAYGIDTAGGPPVLLMNAPKTVTCPLSLPSGVKRGIPSMAVYGAWGFNPAWDQLSVPDAKLNAYPLGAEIPGSLSAIRDAASGSIYVVDGPFKRHVASLASLWAWHLSSYPNVAPQVLDALQTGPDLPDMPVLVKGSGAGIYLLDAPLPVDGSLDAVACTGLSGWAMDPYSKSTVLQVQFSVDGPLGTGASFALTAGQHRADLCTHVGSCDHGLPATLPLSLQDGKPHAVYAYGLNASSHSPSLLQGSPRSLTCTAQLPSNGVKRAVGDVTPQGAWRFDAVMDLLKVPDATLAGFAAGPAWPSSPTLLQDGATQAIYLVEGTTKRHVPSMDAFTAWHFQATDLRAASSSQLSALTSGSDLPERPVLLQGSSGGTFILDASAPSGNPTSPTPSSGGPAGNGATGPSPGKVAASCAAAPGSSPLALLAGGLLLVLRRRARGPRASSSYRGCPGTSRARHSRAIVAKTITPSIQAKPSPMHGRTGPPKGK